MTVPGPRRPARRQILPRPVNSGVGCVIALVSLCCLLTSPAWSQSTAKAALEQARAQAQTHLANAAAAEQAGDAATFAQEMVSACGLLTDSHVVTAYATCTRAIESAASLGLDLLEAEALAFRATQLAWVPTEWENGVRDATRALTLLDERPGHVGVRMAALALGAIYREQGDADAAVRYLQLAVARSAEAGDRSAESLARAMMTRTLFWMGDYLGARVEGEEALVLARQASHLPSEFFANWELGMTELEGGRFEASIPSHEEALRLATEIGNTPAAAMIQLNLADARSQLGHLDLAEMHLEVMRAAIARSEVPADWRMYVDEIEGRILFAQQRYEEAAARFEQAAAESLSAWLTVRARLGWARALRAAGDVAAAQAAYEETIAQVDATRSGAEADVQRASYMAANTAAYHELISLLWETSDGRDAERAFEISEAGRARALLDALLAAGVGDEASPSALTSTEIRDLLEPDQVLVEYVEVDDRLFAFLVSAEGVQWKALTSIDTTASLYTRVRFFCRLVEEQTDPARIVPAGRRLYQELLAPILAEVGPEITTLIVSPDGVLHYLPFDALVTPEVTGDARPTFLAERYTVVYTPSGSLLARQHTPERSSTASVLAVSAPMTRTVNPMLVPTALRAQTGLDPLPFARLEAEAVASRMGGAALALIGDAASEATLKGLPLNDFRILHFATHAFIDENLPLRSSLLLGAGDGEDGLLQADEIYAMSLSADLVVLSACRTGLGMVLGSEGVQSLGRAFLYAGARDVIATLWEIEDRGSVDLMSRFYDRFADGESSGASLAAVKRELIAAGAPPRTWAAFVMIGQPGSAPGPAAPVPIGLLLMLAAVASLVGVVTWRMVRQRS